MDDQPYIRLVDAHPECDRRHHDVHVVVQKAVLSLPSDIVIQAGVVRQRLETAE